MNFAAGLVAKALSTLTACWNVKIKDCSRGAARGSAGAGGCSRSGSDSDSQGRVASWLCVRASPRSRWPHSRGLQLSGPSEHSTLIGAPTRSSSTLISASSINQRAAKRSLTSDARLDDEPHLIYRGARSYRAAAGQVHRRERRWA
jgi:hypothetical protein